MKIVAGLSNGQVLQRLNAKGATALVTGTCSEAGPIYATISKGTVALKGWKKRPVGYGARGKFAVKLAAIPVGGPYRLRLESGRAQEEIAAFFVGDVWILAGQSNMEGCGSMTGPAKPHPLVRAFSMRREWRAATEPLHLLAESPDACHAAVQCSVEKGEELRRTAVKGVGVGLFFAREMVERSGGVPQGLLCTAHGGTSMEQWSPSRKKLGGESLYASMLASVKATGQPVAGLLWYQGESDVDPVQMPQYTGRMKALVAASRRDLRQPRLPWVIVQLGRHVSDQPSAVEWNGIQEQQRLLPGVIANLDTVPAVDLPLDDGIHIGAEGFPRLATRLASAADRMVYGNKHEVRGPQLRKTKPIEQVNVTTFDVAFDFVRGGLQAQGEPTGFRFVGPDGVPVDMIFRTELRGNVARLHLRGAATAGMMFHYGHGRDPYCNITDARGFLVPVFGPIPVSAEKFGVLLPFFTQWNLSPVVPAEKPLNRVTLAEVKALAATPKTYPANGFVSEHDSWQKKSGHCFFHARLTLSEPMQLFFRMGYDGPFRLWIDDEPFFVNMKGTNPCIADESIKLAKLAAGTHDIRVGMDLNGGQAWGFMLRLSRKDVTKEQVKSGDFAKPDYSV
jgi:hypothetical protein